MNFTGFKQYLAEEEKTVYFTFSKMNPPSASHGNLLECLSTKSEKNPYRIYASTLQESTSNPLEYFEKIKYVRRMFPKQSRSVVMNEKIKNIYDAATNLFDEGFKNIVMVVEDNRVHDFEVLLNKYNGIEGKHGIYNFKSIKVESSESVNPDKIDTLTESASNNDFIFFSNNLPKNVSDKEAKNLFNAVRCGMGLKEEKEFKNHIQLKSVSDIREQFVSQKIFNVNDFVMIKDIQEKALITHRGSNYLILEKEDGTTTRKWIDSVEVISEAYEIGTDEYRKHYAKGTPGQHIKKVDETNAVLIAKKRIDKEKSNDNRKHKQMMDRAKTKDKRIAKKQTSNMSFENFLNDLETLSREEGK